MDYLLYNLSVFFVFLPLIIGWLKRKSLPFELLPLFYLLNISCVIGIIGLMMAKFKLNNLLLYDIYTIIEFIFISILYKRFFEIHSKIKLHSLIIFLFILLTTADVFFISGTKLFSDLSTSVEAIVFMLYSLIAFYVIIKNLIYKDVLKEPFFWINVAILIYFSGNLFLLSNNLLRQGQDVFRVIYQLHSVLNCSFFVTIALGFWKIKKANNSN